MIVVADPSPLNYLVLSGEQELLPSLFGRIVIPEAVFQEFQATVTPRAVQKWLAQGPDWLEIRKTARTTPDTTLSHLDEGEPGRRGTISSAFFPVALEFRGNDGYVFEPEGKEPGDGQEKERAARSSRWPARATHIPSSSARCFDPQRLPARRHRA